MVVNIAPSLIQTQACPRGQTFTVTFFFSEDIFYLRHLSFYHCPIFIHPSSTGWTMNPPTKPPFPPVPSEPRTKTKRMYLHTIPQHLIKGPVKLHISLKIHVLDTEIPSRHKALTLRNWDRIKQSTHTYSVK